MQTMFRLTLPMLATLLTSTPVAAVDLSYDYAQAGYQTFTGDADDGFFFGGSFRINDEIYVAGEYDHWEASERVSGARGQVEFTSISARGGYIFPFDDGLDFYGELGLASNRVKVSARSGGQSLSSSDSDIGLVLTGGARMALTPEIEVRGGLELFTGDYDEKFLTAEGLFHFNEQFSLVGSLSRAMEVSEFRMRLGARFHF